MGFTTIVEINNDFLDDIQKDPKRFVETLYAEIQMRPGVVYRSSWKIVAMEHRDYLKPWYAFKKKRGWQ